MTQLKINLFSSAATKHTINIPRSLQNWFTTKPEQLTRIINNKTFPRQYGRPQAPQHTSPFCVIWTTPKKNVPTRQTPGMSPHGRNQKFKIPGLKKNLAYHLPRRLPRYGERYEGSETAPPPPRSTRLWCCLLENTKTSHRNEYRNLARNLVGRPPPNPTARTAANQQTTALKVAEWKGNLGTSRSRASA